MAFKFNKHEYQEDKVHGVLIPVGEYDVRITEAQEKISQSSGNDMIELVCQPTDEKIKGKLWAYIVDNEYAAQKIGEILNSCGVSTNQIPETITAKTFLGKVGRVKVRHTNKNGEPKAEINYWIKPKAGESAPSQGNTSPAPDSDDDTKASDVPF